MGQKTGRVTIKLNADTLVSKAGARLQTGGVSRTTDMSDQGSSFFMEQNKPAQIRATMIHTAQTDLEALRAFKNGTVTFQTDTGRSYTVANAHTEDLGELQNGEVEITIGGDPAVQS